MAVPRRQMSAYSKKGVHDRPKKQLHQHPIWLNNDLKKFFFIDSIGISHHEP